MKSNLNFYSLFLALTLVLSAWHKPSTPTPDQPLRYIIKINDQKSASIEKTISASLELNVEQVDITSIFPSLSLYSLIISSELSAKQIEKKLNNISGIISYHKDAKTSLRTTTPNDIDFTEQWNLELIGAPTAWDKTTGGQTELGHDIVIAIIDNGFDIAHEDLKDNIWTNEAEIPDNGIDDDRNGYVDDYRGANTVEENGNIPSRTHGTGVAGIIGAKGNNRLGISGINWDVKMMLIAGQAFVSEIIQSYNYALTQRRLFNQSNGEEGALVVATNFSSGIDEAFAEEYPLWCEVYNELGNVGILNVTAAPNNGKDIDQVGDMPSTCTSDYLIVVNNIDRTEELASDSGFGSMHIDLAAPGDDAPSLSIQNGYNDFSGTSSSTPHVAGAIGLMYSLENTNLGTQAITSPSEIARCVKYELLETVTKRDLLADKNTSSGRLNLGQAVNGIEMRFNNVNSASLKIIPNPIIAGNLSFNYLIEELETHLLEVHDAMGRLIYRENFQPNSFELITKEVSLGERLYQGIYYLSVSTENKIMTKSFLVL